MLRTPAKKDTMFTTNKDRPTDDINNSLLEFDLPLGNPLGKTSNSGIVTQTQDTGVDDKSNNDGNNKGDTGTTQQQQTLPVAPFDVSQILAVNLHLPQFTSDRPEMCSSERCVNWQEVRSTTTHYTSSGKSVSQPGFVRTSWSHLTSMTSTAWRTWQTDSCSAWETARFMLFTTENIHSLQARLSSNNKCQSLNLQ
ncbi:hypothetical protein KQX54_014515 [Cotesia glomerata]|uniref:Uncharacterized protein n=1 Tax=Cotesia glomerata TaxID=32391 RepID=A0AAV7HEG5_COTGL|nr:hypothetical protein KQX54_014515 [Cotesia glomerata]